MMRSSHTATSTSGALLALQNSINQASPPPKPSHCGSPGRRGLGGLPKCNPNFSNCTKYHARTAYDRPRNARSNVLAVNAQQCAEQPPGPKTVFQEAWHNRKKPLKVGIPKIRRRIVGAPGCTGRRPKVPMGELLVLFCWNCPLSRIPPALTSDVRLYLTPQEPG